MAIIKQGILGGFKKKIGSVVGSSWKGKATMRSLPLSVANPRTALQVENRNRFKACAAFASLVLASIIKPLMDRFAGQMSGYNMFTKLNKEVFADPSAPVWANLVISKGKMIAPNVAESTLSGANLTISVENTPNDRYGLPTDKIFALCVEQTTGDIVYQGDTGATREDETVTVQVSKLIFAGKKCELYVSFLRADGSEVSNTGYKEITA